jgi:glyoxylase-like metal-dependent hydrolase (beta-lactamase superfamily II)
VKAEKEADIFERLPPAPYRAESYEIAPAPPTRLLDDGDIVELGDRHFEVLHLPGHSPGSIALWEAATGILFSGDVVYDGELLDDVIQDYIASMELRRLPVRVVHSGHYPSFGSERYLELIDAICAASAGSPRRRGLIPCSVAPGAGIDHLDLRASACLRHGVAVSAEVWTSVAGSQPLLVEQAGFDRPGRHLCVGPKRTAAPVAGALVKS